MDSWLQMLSPVLSLRMPASGDVSMDYNPWTNWGISRSRSKIGSPEIETAVFWEVALPGKQLGKLTDAVLALGTLMESMQPDILEQHPEQAKAIQELKTMAREVERKKDEIKKTAEGEALEALERLKRADAQAYRSLVDEMQKDDT